MGDRKETDVKIDIERYEDAVAADLHDRKLAQADQEFAYDIDGAWDDDVKAKRSDRPCLSFNQLPVFIDQVEGDLRLNSPSIRVEPADDRADVKTAAIMQGICRNVEVVSQAEIAYVNAAQCAASCGRGFYRIVTRYVPDDFFQEMAIIPIDDPFSVVWDGAAQDFFLRDAQYMFFQKKMSRDVFKKIYPDASPASFKDDHPWCDEKTVQIAEVFEYERVEKEIFLLPDGKVVEENDIPEGIEPVKSRKADAQNVMRKVISGVEVLEPSEIFPSRYYPIIPVWGKTYWIKKGKMRRGIVRYAHDAVKMYNYMRSLSAEAIALAPKQPWVGTTRQLKNHLQMWENAHTSNTAVLVYDSDPLAPGAPQRNYPTQVQTGINAEVQIAAEETRATTGMRRASMGMASNETSGKAIAERKREGDTGTFAFIDNLAKSVVHGGRVMIDIIPGIYDTPRILRILGKEDEASFVKVNDNSTGEMVNDLSLGRYDVVVKTGPGVQTERELALEKEMQLVQWSPDLVNVIGDLIAKDIGGPRADEIAERLAPKPPQPPPPGAIEKLQLENVEIKAKVEKLLAEAGKIKVEAMKTAKEIDETPPNTEQK